MNSFLRKYFWLIYLIAIFLGTIFLGKATSHLIESFLFIKPNAQPKQISNADISQVRWSVTQTLERNIFCSFCKPPEPAHPTDSSSPEDQSPPQKTSLPLVLVGTMIVPNDINWAFAFIKNDKNEVNPYKRGSRLPGTDAIVVQVLAEKVYIQLANKKIEYLDLSGPAVTPKPPIASPVAMNHNSELDKEIDDKIKCKDNVCTTNREFVDKLMANTTALSSMGRFFPVTDTGKPDGKPIGVKVIMPRGLFAKIGMKSGDVLQQINGLDLSSTDKALEAYSKLKTANRITLSVKRGSEPITLTAQINP